MSGDKNRQLPSSMVAEQFGEVNVRALANGQLEVVCTLMMTPSGVDAEGWQTGVALDASASMKGWYGKELQGTIPPDLQAEYVTKGWITKKFEDGREATKVSKDAYQDAIHRGHLMMAPNLVETQARQFISYLAAELDADGGTTAIYWACGPDGSDFEVIGDFTAEECKQLKMSGPKTVKFGNGTRLLPAMKYFVDRFRDASNGMYVFLTDGRLDDLESVKQYTTQLAREIAAGRKKPVKCVLIGIGTHVEESQMEELDDLDTGTEVDIWDHKIAVEMRSVLEIFAEVVSDNQMVAPTGQVYDDRGNVVRKYSDGLPAKITVTLPAGTAWFELEAQGMRIRQSLVASVSSK